MMLFVGILVVVLLAGSFYFLYGNSGEILQDTISKSALEKAEGGAKTVTEWLTGIRTQVEDLSLVPAVTSMEWQQQEPILARIAQRHDYILGIWASGTDGKYTYTAGVGEEAATGDISSRAYFKKAMRTGESVVSQTIIDQVTGKAIVCIGTPLRRDGEVVGFLCADVTLAGLQQLAREMHLFGFGYGWIIDNEQYTLAHPQDDLLGNRRVLDEGNQALREIARKMANGEEGVQRYRFQGDEKILAYAPVELTG
ncbi:MAG: cache domain-containing protein [Synergistales bacterium]|nr:cache domain-containing protein [Synergistales bacterium]